ncbi:MAG: nicotinate (nicotinamide) nucleotide adenylyltransferase [Akkermansiaceae bacterium]|nr:nicotinate (nicotinamide) nucleotide adenylyltransferase [Akkermansiaceae bacterium]
MTSASRIGLFGGTFDPVHLGHVAMAEAAHEALKLDWVHYLPCRISPHKLDQSPTSAEHRLEMLKLASANQDWAVVNDIETRREGPSYSWMTAEDMSRNMPESRLFWIMGSDQWEALERWNQPQRLANCVEFVVFHRGREPEPRAGYRLRPLPAVHEAMATEIRKRLVAGEKKHLWLDEQVAGYIEQHRLYTATS